jgi:hypothetical protein
MYEILETFINTVPMVDARVLSGLLHHMKGKKSDLKGEKSNLYVFHLSNFPKQHQMIITPLLKFLKDFTIAFSYRSISLLDHIGKLYGKILYNFLSSHV